MSDTNSLSLEDAIAEVKALKAQLSSTDLEAFTELRKHRTENQTLKAEITRLMEESVGQSFAAKALEKAKTKLEAQVAELQGELSSLQGQLGTAQTEHASLQAEYTATQAKVADLEPLAARLPELESELEKHKSQELHLSQELEQIKAANAAELENLKLEHSKEFEAVKGELEKTKDVLENEMAEKLTAKEQEISKLQNTVEQFKAEFLSQEAAPEVAAAAAPESGGGAFILLRDRMEGLLGFPGRTLVEQVFRLCGADESTTDPELLEEAFEALQDTAAKLVRSPEQEAELGTLLKSTWQELGLGGGGQPAPVTEPAAVEEAIAEPPATEEAADPPAAAEEPISEPPVAEEVPAEQPAEQPAEETPEPVAEPTPDVDSPAEVAAEAPQSQEEQVAEAPVEAEPSPEEPSVEPSVEESSVEEPSVEEAPAEVVAAEAPSEEVAPEQPEVEVSEEVPPAEAVTEEDMPPVTEAPAEVASETAAEEPAPAETVADEPVAEEPEVAVAAAEEVTPEPPAAEPVAEELPADVEEPASAEAAPEEAVPEEVSQEPEPAEAEAAPVEPAPEPEVAEAKPVEEVVEQVPVVEEAPAPAEEPPAAEGALDFDSAAAALQDGDFAKALPVFAALAVQEPNEPTYLVGQIAALAGLERYEEAYALGKDIKPNSLGDSEDVYRDSFEAVLVGLINSANSDLVRKKLLVDLIDVTDDHDRVMAYLDEADNIGLRTIDEGMLSFLQAKHRVGQDDVTDYLVDAMQGVGDRLELFSLLNKNLERYPELKPLSDFMERLLGSSRAESLEAETGIKDLLTTDESIEELLDEVDPGEEAVVQVFLEHLIPRSQVHVDVPSEEFEEWLHDSEPAAFVGSLRQALRSVDYTVFFDEIDVLSYDGDDHFLLRSSPEPKPTLMFGSDVDDVPPEELRFLVLRELFSMNRRHSQLGHISTELDDSMRWTFTQTCLDIHKDADFKIPEELLSRMEALKPRAQSGAKEENFKVDLEALLADIYQATESDSFLELGDFLYGSQLNRKWLDPISDGFGARQTGLVVASYAIARDHLDEDSFETLEEAGFGWLYKDENLDKYGELRLRLQRLWTLPFKALISDGEE